MFDCVFPDSCVALKNESRNLAGVFSNSLLIYSVDIRHVERFFPDPHLFCKLSVCVLRLSISENSFTFVSPVLLSLNLFTTIELKSIKWLAAPQVSRTSADRRFHFLPIK